MAVKCLKEILAHSLAVTLTELLNISGLDVVLLHMRGGKLEYLSAPKGQHILPCLRTDKQTLSLVAYAQTDRYKCKGTESDERKGIEPLCLGISPDSSCEPPQSLNCFPARHQPLSNILKEQKIFILLHQKGLVTSPALHGLINRSSRRRTSTARSASISRATCDGFWVDSAISLALIATFRASS